MFRAPPPRPVPLIFFPDYRESNLYQTLLYEGLHPLVEAEPGTLAVALERQSRTPAGSVIFHLHWEDAVLKDGSTTTEGFLDDLVRFRDRGGAVIWTVHNLIPHEAALRERVMDLQCGLVSATDIVHMHSLPAVTAVRSVLPVPPERIRVIPHGDYDGAFPTLPGALSSRGSGTGMTILFPGRIASYKQPEMLISAFSMVARPEDRLLLAGQAAVSLDLSGPDDPRITCKLEFVSAEEVARLHAEADFVVLPYTQSLTSGSAILAATLSRAVLGPDVPGLRDVVESPRSGVLYDPTQPSALADALAAALNEGPHIWTARGEAARAAMLSRSRRLVSAGWCDVINALLARAAPARVGSLG